MSTPKINLCLSMIVRNESRVICRLLESAYRFIDCYSICDTGSDDRTPEIIREFMDARGIPGQVIHEPFRNFEYSRNYALFAAEEYQHPTNGPPTHLLFLDADMIFWGAGSTSRGREPTSEEIAQFREKLGKFDTDAFYVFQGSEKFFYKNVRAIRTGLNIHYKSVTHEYICTPDGARYHTFPREQVFINDIGDGGCKTNKFERDVKLLSDDIKEHPENVRSWFYLGNSYHDLGNHEKAIEAYKHRITMGGWIEEVYYSHFRIGQCYVGLKRPADAIMHFMLAFETFPYRIESLYEIIHYFRNNGKNQLAYMYYTTADKVRSAHKNPDYLFVNNEVYMWKLDYEMTIIGYYCNIDNYDMPKICMNVLSRNSGEVDNYIIQNVFSNYKFYAPKVRDGSVTAGVITVEGENLLYTATIASVKLVNEMSSPDEFVSSTPSFSISEDGNEILLNVRFVNYRIGEHGEYINREHIKTINVLSIIRRNPDTCYWEFIKSPFIMPYDKTKDNVYVGIEDVRLLSPHQTGKCLYSGNRGLDRGSMLVEIGTIQFSAYAEAETVSGFITVEKNHKEVEKNWVLYSGAAASAGASAPPKMVYNWSELCMGNIQPISNGSPIATIPATGDCLFLPDPTEEKTMPEIFKHLRGSANGITVKGKNGAELWFITHMVSYEDRRFYYHMIVVLDANTNEVLRYTKLFTFEGSPVEYCLGFIELDSNFVFGYSILDRKTKYITLSRHYIESLMV